MDRAVAAAHEAPPTAETVESLGAAWVAEEALAIALFCTLEAESFEQGVLLAINCAGDSDSTGSMTGTILGLLFGRSAIPKRWLDRLELRQLIEEVAADLSRTFTVGGADGGNVQDAV